MLTKNVHHVSRDISFKMELVWPALKVVRPAPQEALHAQNAVMVSF